MTSIGPERSPIRSAPGRRLYGSAGCNVPIVGDHGGPRDLGCYFLRPWIAEGVRLVRWIRVEFDRIAGVGAHWTFLSDAGRTVQKYLDIAEYTDPVHNPMIPHTIILEPGLVVFKIYNSYWFLGRPTLEEL